MKNKSFTMCFLQLVSVVVLATCMTPILALSVSKTQAVGQDQRVFGGGFDSLSEQQQGLVRSWVEKFNELFGTDHSPEEIYAKINLSDRTTFDAVTHALQTTELTAEDGSSLGTALDLVGEVEAIKGRVPGAGGDLQFRLYVLLKPGVMETLHKSREFSRSHDNTIYHKGYPICFRQGGGVPSIQVSISNDEKRADIDVDYRSSKFPAALLNGHLTAANSDVTAGNNYDRHSNRWAGLQNWWRGWFGLPLIDQESEVGEEEIGTIPDAPRKGRGKIQDAAQDFLSSWLVEQKPEQSVAYFSDRAMDCVGLDDEGEPLGRAMSRLKLLRDMMVANDTIGPLETLDGTVIGVRLATPLARAVQQPYHSQFVLYDVPVQRAEQLTCANKGNWPEADLPKRGLRYGKYFGTVFHLKAPGAVGATLYLLWTKEAKSWKIVSFDVDPSSSDTIAMDTRPAEVTTVALERVAGDEQFIRANSDFLNSWLVDRNPEEAFEFMSPRAYPCVNLYLREGEVAKETEAQMAARLKEGLKRVIEGASGRKSLEQLLRPVEFVHPAVKVVTHSREEVFALGLIPNEYGDNADCSGTDAVESISQEPSYGSYYATSFQFILESGQRGPTMQLLWTKESGRWKVMGFRLILP